MPLDSIATDQVSTGSVHPGRSDVLGGPEIPQCRPLRSERIVAIDQPLVAAEWDSVRAFVARVEREDLRLRFACSFDVRDETTLRRFFDVKAGRGEMTWALDGAGAIAGLAHRVMVSRSEAEIALVVRSDLKRRGIGELLLRDMLARSAREGLHTLSASVLWENRAALRLVRKIGFVPRKVSAQTVDLTLSVGATAAAA